MSRYDWFAGGTGPGALPFRSGRARYDYGGSPAAVWMNDHDVRRAVLQALSEDRWLDSSSIVVHVRDGVVLLDGEVNDYLEARYAWDDTWECHGVRGVLNRLEVRPSEHSE